MWPHHRSILQALFQLNVIWNQPKSSVLLAFKVIKGDCRGWNVTKSGQFGVHARMARDLDSWMLKMSVIILRHGLHYSYNDGMCWANFPFHLLCSDEYLWLNGTMSANDLSCQLIMYFWFKYDLVRNTKHHHVWPTRGSNRWPPDHDSTFSVSPNHSATRNSFHKAVRINYLTVRTLVFCKATNS